ncbi:MAG TPA: glycerophosphodiester phosphodiesterase family protein [Isosphaeraceae bacterium]|nr:glycerophosphodiester phosphodiesterase family protein [Isosphaeraceae bacterium]
MNINTTTTDEVRPPSPGRLAGTILLDLWHVHKPLIIFEAAFKGAVIMVGALGTAWVISPLIASTGRAAVTNTDIARFLLSPAGSLAAILLAFSMMLGTMIEHVGVMAIVALHLRGRNVTLAETLSALTSVSLRLLSFGLIRLGALVLLCAPIAVLAGITYVVLLSRHDINYYLTDRPPSWYAALGVGAVLAAVLLTILAFLYVSAIFVMPILLFEDRRVTEAVQESRARTGGARLRIGTLVLGWQFLGTMLGVMLVWGFGRGCALLLATAESRPMVLVPLVAGLLTCHALLLAVLSFALVAIQCLLILRLHLERGGTIGLIAAADPARAISLTGPARRRFARLRLAGVLVCLALVGIVRLGLPHRLKGDEHIMVVAHRGYSRAAPENSMSAFRKSIEVGADVIELDVQQTSDGVIVVCHDRDLMRLAGDSRAIAEVTFAELRKLDIGRRFSPEFAGERIATLDEVIALARGEIKLQIELKYYAKDHGLAEKVAELIGRQDFESQCEVSSLDYDGLMKAKQHNPQLKVVALVTYALGDPGRLDVDGLSVNTSVLSDRLIRAARSRGKELYAWTVDDPRAMVRLIERGVGGLVTNAPEELIRIRKERAGLTDLERRLLTTRYLLGLPAEH